MESTHCIQVRMIVPCVFPGEHVWHCDLGYGPFVWCAVTALRTEHVIIAEWLTDILHVHSLDGREVRRHKLGLQRGECVHGVCSSTDGVIHVVVGHKSSYKIASLRAYKVRFSIVSHYVYQVILSNRWSIESLPENVGCYLYPSTFQIKWLYY